MSVYKVTSLNFNSPVLSACVPTCLCYGFGRQAAGRQGWDLNVPNFQQGIYALIIWNIMRLKRRERRQNVFSICSPAMNDGATEKKITTLWTDSN